MRKAVTFQVELYLPYDMTDSEIEDCVLEDIKWNWSADLPLTKLVITNIEDEDDK